jgi:isopentenyl phosphate kinase
MKKLLFVKIGGGLLTDKTRSNLLNSAFIDQIPSLFPKNISDEFDVIIGTGAGSFGHHEAKQHGLIDGIKNPSQLLGMSKAHLSVQQLNQIAVSKLIEGDIPAFSVSPSALFTSSRGRARNVNLKSVRAALSKKLVPVVHGETVIDNERGVEIFSTERTALVIISKFIESYDEVIVIFLTKTNGVLDSHGQTIPIVNSLDMLDFSHHSGIDVTGGMHTKVKAALELTKFGAQVTICNGQTPNAIHQIIHGERLGTLVLPG